MTKLCVWLFFVAWSAADGNGNATTSAKPKDCQFNSINAGDSCTMVWHDLREILRPTQQAVGYAWIQRKLKDFDSAKSSQKVMDSNPTPVIIGPNYLPYMIDDHHTISALEVSGFDSTQVTMTIVCDWSDSKSEADFFRRMASANFVYLLGRDSSTPNALPVPLDPSELPPSVMLMQDDPWRSLAGLARKIGGDNCPKGDKWCMRAYDRICSSSGSGIPFFEFRWAYFMNLAYVNQTYWQNQEIARFFSQLYTSFPFPSEIGKYDVDAWSKAAEYLVTLCRSETAGDYVLPASFDSQHLPGYVSGMGPILSGDPDCGSPTCPASLPTKIHL